MIKKLISILCVLSLSLGLINVSNVFAADAVLSANVTGNTCKVGDSVAVSFDLSDNPGFGALQFDITYNTNALKYVSYEIGSVKGDYADVTVTEEKLTYGGLAFMSNVEGNGTVLTITFEAIADGKSDIEISNMDFAAIDDNAALGQTPLNISGQSTSITVIRDTSSGTTETSTEATTKASVVTTEKQTEATTKAAVATTESQTETTTKKVSSGGSSGAGASSVKVSGYTSKTATTESATEITTKAVKSEPKTETTTDTVVSVNDVKVTIGSKTVVIGDESYNADAAPYIQASSNSTLVPLRFVALAIAGGDVDDADNSDSIVWNSAAKTATIIFDGKKIEFTANSENMVIDGKTQLMENGVKAEITDGRMFVPFRALGNALGVSVQWDASTKTAVYKIK
ncbi:MAG: stalk domain-containing protein [Clostridia bacterium]|nr:stalk domain-containing protein [Clostridia bacterium]